MAIRIPWDEYEVAILIMYTLKVIEGEMNKHSAVIETSKLLRTLAKKRQYDIDEVFRNENGISMQMSIMVALFTNNTSGLHQAPKIFNQIVNIYKSDKDKYNHLLKEAMDLAAIQTDKKELYHHFLFFENPDLASKIFSAIEELEKFSIASKNYKESFFESLDDTTAPKLKKVAQNKFFAIKNRSIMADVLTGITYISEFVNTLNEKSLTENSSEEKNDFNNTEIEEKNKDYILNLRNINTLSFTKPYEYIYKHNTFSVKSWTNLYVSVVRDVYKDYSDVIVAGVNFTRSGRVDVGNQENLSSMADAKPIDNGLYLETNISATDICKKIKGLFELCKISYDEICIKYSSKNKNNISNSEKICSYKDNLSDKDFYEFVISCGLSENTARNYCSGMNFVDSFGQSHFLYIGSIINCGSFEEFITKYNVLTNYQDFIEESVKKHNYPTASLAKYYQYMENKYIKSGTNKIYTQAKIFYFDISQNEIDDINVVLAEHFPDGYRLGNYMHQMLFEEEYYNQSGIEIGKSEEELDELLKHVGRLTDGRIFANKKENNVLSELVKCATEILDNGASEVYLECLYDKYSDRLVTEMSIYDVNSLKSALYDSKSIQAGYSLRSNYIVKVGCETTIEDDILLEYKHSFIPLTYDQVHEKIWYVPFERMKNIICRLPELAYVSESAYIYANNFHVSLSEKNSLISAMHNEIYTRGYLSAKMLYSLFLERCPTCSIDYGNYSDYAIRNILGKLLSDTFTFSSSLITEIGVELTYGDVYEQYVSDKDQITIDDLKEFSKELGVQIYWDNVLKYMIRISPDELVNKSLFKFDVDVIDNYLEQLMDGNKYLILKNIVLYLSFPSTNYKWNGFVLDGYLRLFSKRFKLVEYGFIASDYFGAIIHSDSVLTYNDIAADVLAKSDGWNGEASAKRCLTEAQLQKINTNKHISTIIKMAKQIQDNMK